MPPRARPWPLLVLIVALVALGAVACVGDDGPQLVDVTDATPRELERGDRLDVSGRGFPEGKRAHLVLRGSLLRPAHPPQHDVEIEVAATGASPGRVSVDVDEALEATLCGTGESASPTTFEGDLLVVFPGASPASLPITGALRGVRLDFRGPPPRRAALVAREAEGARLLAFVGIEPSDELPPGGGLAVAAVRPASPADRAGIVPGDVLTRFEGARLRSRADLVPAGAMPVGHVAVRRVDAAPGDPDVVRAVSLAGFRPAAAADLLVPALLLGGLAALLLVLQPPWGRAIAAVERRVLERLRASLLRDASGRRALRGAPLRRGLAAPVLAALRAVLAEDVAPAPERDLGTAPTLAFLGLSALFAALPFGPARFGIEPDAAVLFVGAVAVLVVVALLAARDARGRWSPASALVDAAHVVSLELPGAVAIAAVVAATGSLRVDDVVRAQGGAPWHWLAMEVPGGLVLLVAWLATALADRSGAAPPLPEAAHDPPAPAPARGLRPVFLLLADGAHAFLVAALAAALLLGGWRLPGVAPHRQDASFALQATGAALYLAKTWALVLALRAARQALPRLPLRTVARAARWAFVPLAAIGVGLASLWSQLAPEPAVRTGVAAAACAVALLVAGRVALRVRASLQRPAGPARLSPLV
jgi:NADH-quinone oxidoreductase subunit H